MSSIPSAPPDRRVQADTGDTSHSEPFSHSAIGIFLAIVAYLIFSLLLWWSFWTSHPTTISICGCGDVARYVWFLEWPRWAITHHANLFLSHLVYPPGGANLLSDTSVLGISVPMLPVTWAFGPVASLNAVLILAPVASAATMLLLLKRWTSWLPAAFFGGLAFGFSPFLLNGLVQGWLNLSLVLSPLIVLCVDELIARDRWRPVPTGVALGLLVTWQFFISTEMLLITAMVVLLGVLLIVGRALIWDRDILGDRWKRVATGLGTGGGLAIVLLAYPLWFALAGPQHLSGLVWPGATPGFAGSTASSFIHARATAEVTANARHFGGYQGQALPQGEYLGWSMVALLGIGVAIWWRDLRLRLLVALGVVSAACCLSIVHGVNPFWVPFDLLGELPLAQNIIPTRFAAPLDFCAAGSLALVIDHARRFDEDRIVGRSVRTRWILAVSLGFLALTQPVGAIIRTAPFTAVTVALPDWFTRVAPRLHSDQVLLIYPAPFGGVQAPLAWQAINHLSFSQVGGDGPGSAVNRAGPIERSGFRTIDLGTLGPTDRSSRAVAGLRQALVAWGTTKIVVIAQPGLSSFETGRDPRWAVAMGMAATGRHARMEHHAWTINLPPGWDRSLSSPSVLPDSCDGPPGIPAAGSVSRCASALGIG
jgi:hypothetical protein